MKVLITGSGGFIGRNLVHKFLRIGSSVTALYRSTMPRLHGCEARLALVQHDLSKPLPENTQALEGIDLLIHAASHTHITPNSTMEKYLRSNIEGMKNIIAHQYGDIDDKIVFDSIKNKLEKDVNSFIKEVKRCL